MRYLGKRRGSFIHYNMGKVKKGGWLGRVDVSRSRTLGVLGLFFGLTKRVGAGGRKIGAAMLV
jgi:hypothetical protein